MGEVYERAHMGHVGQLWAEIFGILSKLLLHKLTDYKANDSLILWIKSLCNRKQRVRINGFFSDWVDVISGIPQCAILGPILFKSILINSLAFMVRQMVVTRSSATADEPCQYTVS